MKWLTVKDLEAILNICGCDYLVVSEKRVKQRATQSDDDGIYNPDKTFMFPRRIPGRGVGAGVICGCWIAE